MTLEGPGCAVLRTISRLPRPAVLIEVVAVRRVVGQSGPDGLGDQDAVAFVREYAARSHGRGDKQLAGWQSYCQMLFCSNEFLYVD